MAIHSSVLAGRVPGTAEPGGLPSMGSHRVTQLKRLSSSSRGSSVGGPGVPGAAALGSRVAMGCFRGWALLCVSLGLCFAVCVMSPQHLRAQLMERKEKEYLKLSVDCLSKTGSVFLFISMYSTICICRTPAAFKYNFQACQIEFLNRR